MGRQRIHQLACRVQLGPLTDGGERWSEKFAPCDAYQLMLEHVSKAIDGDESAYVPSSTLSLRTASLIDAVRHKATP